MNERILSRGLSTSVVDTLKAHGHVLVVKGGAAALARELEELIAPAVAVVAPRIAPRGLMADEPTSTFGDEAIDQAVEDLVARLARVLMSSDHVEDVFAEDAVIRRDIFRVLRAGLLEPAEPNGEDATTVTVKLDTLGYVASTVSKRADPATLRDALERAGAVAHARLTTYNADQREATYHVEVTGDDEGLELEEAVADELADLAEQGIAPLPTLERRIDLGRALSAADQRALRPRVDAAAEATLLRSGCAATWDFEGTRAIRITFTPLSEQDARGVDAPAAAFAREVHGLLAAGGAPASEAPRAQPAPAAEVGAPPSKRAASAEPAEAPPRRKVARVKEEAPEIPPAPDTKPSRKTAEPAAAKKTAKRAAPSEPAAAKKTAKRAAPSEPAAAKKTAKRAAPSEPAAKKTTKAPASSRASKAAPAPGSSAKRTGATKTTKVPAKKKA